MLEKRAPKSSQDRYAVIIDAGSSGSRVYVYSWPAISSPRSGKSVLPKIVQASNSKKTVPGISKFSGTKLGGLWNNHLKDLVKHAQHIVPSDEHYRTPIFVLATAGMRLLPDQDQREILDSTCRILQDKTDFYLPECESHISVIDGETEGLYGWLALNYLLGSKDNSDIFAAKDQAQSYGFMDMGGASAQIAFAPNKTEALRHEDDLFHLNIRTTDGKLHDWKVFVSTWLGFGANEARNRFSEHLLAKSEPKAEVVYDPCLPRGATMSFSGTSQNSTVEFKGEGSFGRCLGNMYPLLQKELPCKDDPCLFNGVHVPAIDFDVNRFVGVSEYWYTANDIFDMGGKYDFLKFSSAAQTYCEKPWDQIEKEYSGGDKRLSKETLRAACFKASWVVNILHEGFGVPLRFRTGEVRDGDQIKHIRDDSDQQLSGNTTTAHHLEQLPLLMLHEPGNNTIDFVHNNPNPEVSGGDDDDALSRRDIHDFLDPFQSAVTVNGKDLSWTLGRAVLYSSSQIPPSFTGKDSQEPVGYHPAGESSRFIMGGELSESKPPSTISLPPVSASAQIFFFALLIIGMIGFYLFQSCCFSKAQLHFAYASCKGRIGRFIAKLIRPFKKRRGGIGMSENEFYDQRLLEEGVDDEMYPMRNMFKSPSEIMSPPTSSLATTTSMVDLKGSMMPSRVSSRAGMRDSPVSFSLNDDDDENAAVYKSPRKVASYSRLGR